LAHIYYRRLKLSHFVWSPGSKKLVAAIGIATLGFVLTITTSFASSRSQFCRSYARDYSMRYSAGGAMGGVVRGALGGAAIGGIVGGGRGARRAAGAGAIVGGASRGIQSSTLFDRAYAHCMRGRWP
jgi:uncharacterized protein YcfJ